uniref:Actin-binding LIM protein 1 n=1 Tax=Plectus sambesii TaxID=2011161 RepID=A0A914VGH2_9BILA
MWGGHLRPPMTTARAGRMPPPPLRRCGRSKTTDGEWSAVGEGTDSIEFLAFRLFVRPGKTFQLMSTPREGHGREGGGLWGAQAPIIRPRNTNTHKQAEKGPETDERRQRAGSLISPPHPWSAQFSSALAVAKNKPRCWPCQRPLTDVGFFVHKGHYYCPTDYHSQFGERCPACKQFVDGNVVQCNGQTFHQRCFKCTRCQQAFPSGEKVTFNGENHVCQRCLKKSPGAPVGVKPTQLNTDERRPISPPGVSSPTVCAACDQLIHSGQVLLALDSQWHIWCFKCTACDSVLHGEYMTRDGKPYCLRDYNAHFGVRCYECDKFIAGRVLQAGGYKFHPTCARCSRCGEHFGDGEEMYMQGDEIWHPRCQDVKPPDRIVHTSPKSPRSSSAYEPKYQQDFGKHLTYMYLLPEAESTYLKHPIEPHPPPPAQFHTPQGPVKIRRSRMSMLKTGMQRLTEDLDKNTPRSKSPHMDNEEPIEMAHYPAGHAPNPDEVPPIDRDDFPAPPYPYAVEELKRRLSSSSVENDEDEEQDAVDLADGEKLKKEVEELDKFQKDSSIAHVFMHNLEERQKKTKLPLHWDPRNASRTPSAKKMPHLKCRYETPINASPSRYLNRPKPWIYWSTADRAATTTIPYFAAPRPGYGLAPKAATLPEGYHYADMSTENLNTTISSQYSDHSLPRGGGTLPPHMSGTFDTSRFQPSYGGGNIRSSLPDMSKPPKIFPLHELQTTNKNLPEEVDRCHLERHLNRETFEDLFKMTPIEFYKLPEWKRVNMKRKVKLF